EALDLEPERRELARRGIACASRPESVKHEGRDPEQAASPGPGLVVVDQDHRRPAREPPLERRHERLPLGGDGAGTEEGADRGSGRLVGARERHARPERGRQTARARTEHGDTTLERSQQLESASRQRARHRCAMSVMNSSRVFWFVWKLPSIALVVTREFCFSTPRMRMQRRSASRTTPTPRGPSCSWMVVAICVVMRSWTWSRRANTSTKRASLLMPTMRSRGMYATCALPKKGMM